MIDYLKNPLPPTIKFDGMSNVEVYDLILKNFDQYVHDTCWTNIISLVDILGFLEDEEILSMLRLSSVFDKIT